MPYTFKVDVAEHLVRVKATGVCTYAEVTALSRAIAKDPLFVKGMPSLVDYTEARLQMNDAEARAYAQTMRGLASVRGKSRIAAVTTGTGANDFLVRFFDILADVYESPIRAQRFDNEAEAMRWLREEDG
jgi:hypothetical protein